MLADGGRRAALAVLVALSLLAGLTGAVRRGGRDQGTQHGGDAAGYRRAVQIIRGGDRSQDLVTYGLAAVLRTSVLEGAPADVLVLTSPRSTIW